MKRAAVFLFSLALLILPAAALADVEGSCTITMNGVDANQLATPKAALDVPKDGSIAIEASTEAGSFTGHSVYLEYSGIKWKVDEAADDGKSWSGSVDVADYAKYGVGLYKVSGDSSGVPCSGWAYVNVTGNPLGTVAGAAAAGATVVGGALMTASAISAGRKPRGRVEAQVAQLQFSKESTGYTGESDDYFSPSEVGWIHASFCLVSVPIAALQTVAFMVSGAGTPGAPAVKRKKGGIHISVVGVIGAILAAFGTLVLLQQFGVVYPTAMITLGWIVCWVVADVLLTTTMRRSGVKKARAIIDAARAAAQASAGSGEPV